MPVNVPTTSFSPSHSRGSREIQQDWVPAAHGQVWEAWLNASAAVTTSAASPVWASGPAARSRGPSIFPTNLSPEDTQEYPQTQHVPPPTMPPAIPLARPLVMHPTMASSQPLPQSWQRLAAVPATALAMPDQQVPGVNHQWSPASAAMPPVSLPPIASLTGVVPPPLVQSQGWQRQSQSVDDDGAGVAGQQGR